MIHTILVLCFALLKGLTFDNTNAKDITYRVYRDFQLSGCQLVNLNTAKKSRLACAIFCSSKSSCAAFKFLGNSSDCFTCQRHLVTGINFMTGEFTSLPRVMRQSNWPIVSNQITNRSVAVPGGMKAGMVVHLTGLVLSFADFFINFDQADDSRNVNFHFNARIFSEKQNPSIVLNCFKGNVWGTEIRPAILPYPFQANTNTSLHILVKEDMFIVYIGNRLCCNYTHVPGMLYTNVKYIRVGGGIQVYEISS